MALALEEISMMHSEVEEKARDRFTEIMYLDDIKHLLGISGRSHLKISHMAMVAHKSKKFRAILDMFFLLINIRHENTVSE